MATVTEKLAARGLTKRPTGNGTAAILSNGVEVYRCNAREALLWLQALDLADELGCSLSYTAAAQIVDDALEEHDCDLFDQIDEIRAYIRRRVEGLVGEGDET